MDSIEIGETIKKLREKKGITIRELAERANVHFSNIYKIEHGMVKHPYYDTISSLLEKLDAKIIIEKTAE